jgi:tetratricopeptide (TPR) repeat protein
MGVALMQEHRLAQLNRKVELAPEGYELRRTRRQIAKIVQSALTDCHNFRRCRECGELLQRRLVELGCVMRVNAGRASEALRIAANQLDRRTRARQRAARDQHVRDADFSGAPDYVRSIAVETVVGEIDADVGELGGQWGESASEAACAIVSAMNCSATSCGLLLALLGAASASGESVAELDDAAARMQYAFYTGDSQGIETILKNLEQFQVEDSLAANKAYQLAYGNWKLSQLYLQPMPDQQPRPNGKSLASKAAQTCVRDARRAVELDASNAEAMAVEAVCDGHSATAHAGSTGCANSKPLRTANGLAPNNPRIKLVQAMCTESKGADPAAVERWRAVVASFEAAAPSRPGKPDWGHVEALTMLGETYLQRGDPVAARDALERALVMAPDYRQAQQLLQAAATRPR